MTPPPRTQVLVIGGGPSGLSAAIELGHRGIDVVLVEPKAGSDPLRPRAKTTSVRTMEHLRRWGLADRLRAVSPLPVAYAQDVVFCTGLFGYEIGRFRNAFGLTTKRSDDFAETSQQVPQAVVEDVLREHVLTLPTVTVLQGWRVVELRDESDGVHASLSSAASGEHSMRADFALGCDGANGIARKAIGAMYEGSSGQLPNVNVTFRSQALEQNPLCAHGIHYWVVGAERGGLMGRLDLDGTWWAIVQGVADEIADEDAPALVRQLVGADIDVEVLATDPWQARMLLADRYRGNRVFLVGDAAHLNPPWGGHGFNTCTGDAVNIAWKLAAVLQGWGGDALLASYELERRPVARRTIDAAGAQEAFMAPAFRHPDLNADNAEGIRRRAEVGVALQVKDPELHSLGLVLGYDYPDSPIVAAELPIAEPMPVNVFTPSAHPGARLPHAWLADGSSLFDRLGDGFSLVCFSAAPRAVEAGDIPLSIIDVSTEPELRSRYAADFVLVRPDQHVAWRGDDPEQLPEALRLAAGW